LDNASSLAAAQMTVIPRLCENRETLEIGKFDIRQTHWPDLRNDVFSIVSIYITSARTYPDLSGIRTAEKSNDQITHRQGCTGHRGSRGIGAASARALADEGANVAISYVASADKAEAVVKELKAKGVKARAFKADQAN